MGKIMSLSINLSKINKEKLYEGKNGKYLNLTIGLNDKTDQYGNQLSAWESQSKEERESKETKNYLGNGKVVWSNDSNSDNKSENKEGLPF